MKLVGITGTNGKTTVSYLVESILSAAGLEPGVIGTIDYRYRGRHVPSHHTTPESLELQSLLAEMETAGVQSVAMEVSSHALIQERVRGIDFDVALFTNLSRDHLDYHASMDDYFSAKSKLFMDYLKVSVKAKKAAVIYGGDARGRELLLKVHDAGLEAWSYGEENEWEIHPVKVQSDVAGLRTIKVQGSLPRFFLAAHRRGQFAKHHGRRRSRGLPGIAGRRDCQGYSTADIGAGEIGEGGKQSGNFRLGGLCPHA